jgi:putative membrane protein
MSPAIQTVLKEWSLPWEITVLILLAGMVYLRGWLRITRHFPSLFPIGKPAAFLSGLFLLWVAVGSPLTVFDDVSLTAHMVQHILLMAVVPPLLLLGAPQLPLLHGLPRVVVRDVAGPILRWAPTKWLMRAVTRPGFCWIVATVALIGWHLPVAFESALRSEGWHRFEHTCFLTTSLLFWWPVVQPWPAIAKLPRWGVPLYLFAATLPADLLAASLSFSERILYPFYLTSGSPFSVSPLTDQATAGALMWVCGTFLYLIPAVAITLRILTLGKNQTRNSLWHPQNP